MTPRRPEATGTAGWPSDPGTTRFVVGANLPWVDYGNDFGASAWHPAGGLSARPESLARLDRTLGSVRQDGIGIVRHFLLCDGRSGIRFDDAGRPTGLDDVFFADVDALVAAARRHAVRLIPTLLDFHLCAPRQMIAGVQLGGRAHLLREDRGRGALIDRVLAPILERYGEEDAILAWDLMNEPEWCVQGLPDSSWAPVPFSSVQAFLREAAAAVRGSARQPVTVGSAGTWNLDLVKPLGLDFYQVHWYEAFGWRALERPVRHLRLDRPVILGEFSGRHPRIPDVLQAARQAGYQGAFVWSLLANDGQSGYSPELVAWARANAGPGSGSRNA